MNTREVANQYRLNKWTELVRECRSSGQTVSAWCVHYINPCFLQVKIPHFCKIFFPTPGGEFSSRPSQANFPLIIKVNHLFTGNFTDRGKVTSALDAHHIFIRCSQIKPDILNDDVPLVPIHFHGAPDRITTNIEFQRFSAAQPISTALQIHNPSICCRIIPHHTFPLHRFTSCMNVSP